MERFSVDPITWKKINRMERLELIAKRQLDIEYENHVAKEAEEG